MLLHEPLPKSRALVPSPESVAPAVRPRSTWRLWAASAASSAGLALVALAYHLERAAAGEAARPVFWAGLALIVFPLALVQLGGGLARRERIGIVLLAGLELYAVKVLHDPALFTGSDEFTHLAATQRLAETRHLYEQLPIGGVTVAGGFPGLHIVTLTLSDASGLSLHTSGLIVIGVARAIFMLAVFLIAENLTKSPRTAALAALLSTANANFLFWSGQFSYESLSLPLFLVAVHLVVTRNDEQRVWLASTVAAFLTTAAIIATHHLTSYALVATFWGLTLLSLRPRWRHVRCLDLALAGTALAATWFALVGTSTGRYLGYVFERTWSAIVDATGQGTRAPFQNDLGYPTPVAERVLGLAAAAIVSLAIVWAVWALWRRPSRFSRPTLLGLTLCGLAFLALFPLKVFPGAWETANRSANFTSIGAAVAVAAALIAAGGRRRIPGRVAITATAAAITVVICGAVIQGWPARVLLSQPVEVDAGGATLRPEGFAAAQWATTSLPRESVYLADEVTGRELAVDGARFTLAGRADGVSEILSRPAAEPWQIELMQRNNVDFALLDARRVSADNVAGYFFQTRGAQRMYPAAVRAKFASLPRSSRVFDSGNIVVYDVRGLRSRPADCADLPARGLSNVRACMSGERTTLFASGRKPVQYGPTLSLALIDAYVERRQSSLEVKLSLQAINDGARPVAFDLGRLRLNAGGRALGGPETVRRVKGHDRRLFNVRFSLTGAAIRRFRAAGAFLTAPDPGNARVRARFDLDGRGRQL